MGYFDQDALEALGVAVDVQGKMPGVVLHDCERARLLLVEAFISKGPVDAKRHEELMALFAGSSASLV